MSLNCFGHMEIIKKKEISNESRRVRVRLRVRGEKRKVKAEVDGHNGEMC